jgi:hypothetical protein
MGRFFHFGGCALAELFGAIQPSQTIGKKRFAADAEYRSSVRSGVHWFENDGILIISPVAHRPSLQRMGIETEKIVNVGGFTSDQKQFLDFHRNAVLLQSNRA